MTDETEKPAAAPETLVTEPRNKFVESQGRLAQPDPQPVEFTPDFTAGVNDLTRRILTAVRELGAKGRNFR